MKLGLIAGNKDLPLLFCRSAKESCSGLTIVAFCFYGETNPHIARYVDKTYWMRVGELEKLSCAIEKEKTHTMAMVGQIIPTKIYKRSHWDRTMHALADDIADFRPHSVFSRLITHFKASGVTFIETTQYMKSFLADAGLMNGVTVTDSAREDADFGVGVISKFVELDVGQSVVVKKKAAVALEGLEGTDNCIKRGFKIAGAGCTVLKFSKTAQDLRFDVPVVGMKTLRLLKRIRAAALVLEAGKVIIMEKEKFLRAARGCSLPVIGIYRGSSL